ncbi:MAG TPA: DNA polymerase Y family protein [Spongiibacteraceae bacterium]|nr:DNA polymerase Y family protein [Spongiibacteraceae bacterium]
MSARDNIHPNAPAREPLWLCLHFTRLALDVFALPDNARAIAVIEQRRVHCANRDNLPAGLSLVTAQALHPDLLALERNPERENDYLQQLAHWAYQFTPGVVIANDNSLLLEIGSCRRLYRGIANLLQRLRHALQERQQTAAFGLAHTPKASWLLAHCELEPALHGDAVDKKLLRRQLASVPVSLLEIDSEAQRALAQMGLTTLGALHDLPAAALGKRFGADCIDYLQKLAGTSPDPQSFFTPAARFQHGLAFIDGVAQRQMLLFPMKRLLQTLDDYLRARQLHCHTLRWQLFDAHRLQVEFSIELSRAQHRWHDLLELSRLKLEQIASIESVFSMQLLCEDFFEQMPSARQLFPDENDQREAAAALADRLQARLGKSALQHLTVQNSHWPESAWCESTDASSPDATAIEALRPLWLLPSPRPLTQRDQQPCWQTPLTLLRGPERIGNHWWQEDACERDYYIARDERGLTCWIYCERVTLRWFLHGLFA